MTISNITSKKDLAMILSAIEDFKEPIAELEQYITPSEIASELLWTALMDGNIRNKKVADMGCGTGIFSFGAALLEAESVIGYDIDNKALEIAKKNMEIVKGTKIPIKDISFVKKDIRDINERFDTVLMNPPFGVQKKGADKEFLEKAFKISKNVYSIHKFGNEEFLEKFAKDNRFRPFRITEKTINLKPMMHFHKEFKHPVKVMLWKFSKQA